MPSPARKEILALEVCLDIKTPQLRIALNSIVSPSDSVSYCSSDCLPACMPAQQLGRDSVGKIFCQMSPWVLFDSL